MKFIFTINVLPLLLLINVSHSLSGKRSFSQLFGRNFALLRRAKETNRDPDVSFNRYGTHLNKKEKRDTLIKDKFKY